MTVITDHEVEAAARAIYSRRFENVRVDVHFDWYHRHEDDPSSSVHHSNVALALLDARAALEAAAAVRSSENT